MSTVDPAPAAALAAALDLVADPVLVLDDHARIIHANPAVSGMGGVDVDRLLGLPLRTVLRSLHDSQLTDAILGQVMSAEPWSGVMSGIGSAGAEVELHVTADPVVTADGTWIVLVLRDLSDERRLAAERARQDADRAAILSLMADVRPSVTVEETAASLCAAVASVDDIDGAMIMLLPRHGDLVHVADAGLSVPGMESGAPVPLEQLEQLVATTTSGPWVLDLQQPWARDLVGGDRVDGLLGAGIQASAYAAIRSEGAVIGVLSVASTAPDGALRLTSRLAGLEHLAGLAGAVFGQQAVQFAEVEAQRNQLRPIIQDGLFHPVFQPMVRLGTGDVLAYEALTRFDDGCRPDLRFAAAHDVGLGPDLEVSCARIALEAAAVLPPDIPVSINLSPAVLLSGQAGSLLSGCARPLVVEITEHAQIDSYEDLRQALDGFERVEVAVDDAGAGFASLRHILELQPHYVKLDMGLVRDVDHDPARAALVAGMCHFASVTGARLVAEGVETRAEADLLLGLGVELAQGFLFGRPAPL